ncbi:hypothetical protein CPB83DRAFT_902578, partial [Crepidotus variabilis]
MSLLLNFLNTAYDYLSPQNSPTQQIIPLSIAGQPTEPLKLRLDAACQSPSSSLANLSPTSMRRELDLTKHDLARTSTESIKLEERVKMLERTLKDTREILRTREGELDKLRREKEKERILAERRRSEGSHQQQLSSRGSQGSLALRQNGASLDTRMAAADLAHRMRLHHDDSRTRTPSPAYTNSTSQSSSSVASSSTDLTRNGTSTTTYVDEEERARLRSQEVYMSRIDSWSGAQVLQAVQDINSEILQFAASATEMCTFLPSSASTSNNPRLMQAVQDTTARIGPNMTRILSTRDHSQDPLLVQLALQGCVSLCIARALSSFCIGFPSKSDAVLSQIYTHMQRTEPQPTFAKWRALTHQHIHGIYPTLAEYSINELSDTVLRWCSDIFTIANCHSFSRASPMQTPGSSPPVSMSPPRSTLPSNAAAQLRHLYLDQIRRISSAVMRLASVTREEIMSTSFEVIMGDPSSAFDPGEVVDAFGEYCDSNGKILATMELGLRCVTRIEVAANGQAETLNGNLNGVTNGMAKTESVE